MSVPVGAAADAPAAVPSVRELRGDIRQWRRGRVDTRITEALGDAYLALVASAMVLAAIGNAVWTVRQSGAESCIAQGCQEARTVLPWVTVALALVLVLAVARLFGPVYVSPAVGSWLMTAPVDRTRLLRSRLLGTAALGALTAAPVAAGAAAVTGFPAGSVLGLTGATAAVALASVAAAALGQADLPRLERVLIVLLALGAWVGLLLLALNRAPVADPPRAGPSWVVAVAAGAVLAAALLVAALARLDRMHRRDVAAGGALAPGISGALATLDLALAYDVVVAHRWRRVGAVRPRRGGPTGPYALAWLDLVRVRRSPHLLLVPAACVVVPFAGERAGAGPLTVLLASLAAFVAVLPLLSGLRVLTRTPSLTRALPFPAAQARAAALAVPAAMLALYGVAVAPAIGGSLGLPGRDGVPAGIAVGAVGLAAGVRWVTGRPPDYSRPLVSTPAGAVPTNLYVSVVRGFDVLLLASAPLLISPTTGGAVFSVLVSGVVLAYLTMRE